MAVTETCLEVVVGAALEELEGGAWKGRGGCDAQVQVLDGAVLRQGKLLHHHKRAHVSLCVCVCAYLCVCM